MTITAGDVTQRTLQAAAERVRVAGTATVLSYDPARSSATVQIDVIDARRDADGRRWPDGIVILESVPVLWTGLGAARVSGRLAAGDRVLAIWRHAAHDEQDRASRGALGAIPASALPASARVMSARDLIVLPGYHPPAVDLDAEQIAEADQLLIWLADGASLAVGGSSAALRVALAGAVRDEIARVVSAFNIAIAAVATAAAVPVPAPTAPPPPADDLGTARLKVDA